MPPISKETDTAAASEPGAARDKIQARQHTVALEVPVTVNGGRAVEGSNQREPFSESTKTVLVHGSGAVIRLNCPVTPGQLLFLTNERTKKEVVCQVVKSKTHGELSGYVELEFTEAVAGFWGMRFPGEPTAAPARPATPAIAPRPSIEAELEPLSAAPTSEEMAKAHRVLDSKKDASHFTGLVTADAAKTVPFAPELKSSDRGATKADFLESAPNTSAPALEREQSTLQEQPPSPPVSAAPSEPQIQPSVGPKEQEFASAAARLLEMTIADSSPVKSEDTPSETPISEAPTPGNISEGPSKASIIAEVSSLKVEEVKIPAWLDPSARNAAPVAPKPEESKAQPLPAEKMEEPEAQEKKASSLVRKRRRAEPASTVLSTTIFDGGSSSRGILSTPTPEPAVSGGTNKGVWILGAAAVVVLSAAGISWYLRQPVQPEAPRNPLSAATMPATSASTVAPTPSSSTDPPSTQNAVSVEAQATETKAGSGLTSQTTATAAQLQVQPAVLSEPVRKTSGNASPTPTTEPAADVEPAPSRPSLGKVRLAKPRTVQSAHTNSSSLAEPAIEMRDETSAAGDTLATSLVTDSAAPARPAGGEAVPAKLLSSVPPVYPSAAQAQGVSGDVQIDALIDMKGRVSSMKVISGPPLLQQAAKDALRQWKYQPATLNGNRVPTHLTVTIQFHLQ